MQTNSIGGRVAAGAAAGVAATLVLQRLRSATSTRFPSTKPPVRQEPGEFMIDRVEDALPRAVSTRIPESVEKGGARLLALGYGMTFGAAYAIARRRPDNILFEGTMLGLATWAAGYVGWLPATKLMPPITRQRPSQVVTPIVQHAIFGILAAATLRGIAAVAERSG